MDKPKVNIIYDSRRVEKYEPLIKELERQKIVDYEIYPCVMYPDVVASINASHKMIVKEAKEKGLVEVCIGEDDMYFPNENGFEWFLKNKPKVYDLYNAANYIGEKPKGKKGAFKAEYMIGFHLYFIHSRYYDTFLSTPNNLHIDSEQKSPLMYYCYPHPCLQRAGWSSNHKTDVNYNAMFDKEDIYQ